MERSDTERRERDLRPHRILPAPDCQLGGRWQTQQSEEACVFVCVRACVCESGLRFLPVTSSMAELSVCGLGGWHSSERAVWLTLSVYPNMNSSLKLLRVFLSLRPSSLPPPLPATWVTGNREASTQTGWHTMAGMCCADTSLDHHTFPVAQTL